MAYDEDRGDESRDQGRCRDKRRKQPRRPADDGRGLLGHEQVALERLVVGGAWVRFQLDQAGVDPLSQEGCQGAVFGQRETDLAWVEQDGRALHGVLRLVRQAEDAVHDARVGLPGVEQLEDALVVVDLDELARNREALREIDDPPGIHRVRAPPHHGHSTA